MTIHALPLVLLVFVLVAFVAADVRWGGEFKDWVRPQHALTAFGVVAGFLLLRWQLGTQHKNAVQLDATKARNELRLAIYKDLASVAAIASARLQEANSTFMSLRLCFLTAQTSGTRQGLDSERFSFQSLHSLLVASSDAVLGVMVTMEKWEIAIGPHFQAFKAALANHSTDLHHRFADFAGPTSPYLYPQIAGLPALPSPAAHEQIATTTRNVENAGLALILDLWDLRIATQNRLLGDLFQSRVPRRRPTDSSVAVTVLDEDP